MKKTNKQSSTNNPHNWCTDGTEQNQIPLQNCKAFIPCSSYTDTDFTHPSELLSFLCTECETHRFGSCFDAPPQIGVCLTYFLSTVPESFSYSLTWYTSCRQLAAPLVPCLPVRSSVKQDSLLAFMSTRSYRGVGLPGTCLLPCFLAGAQKCWLLPHCKLQNPDKSPAQDWSTALSYSLEKKEHEKTEPFVNEVMQSYSQFCLPKLDDMKDLFAYFFQLVSNTLENHLPLQTSFWSYIVSR